MYYTTINKILDNDPCNPAKVKKLAGNIDYDSSISFKQIYDAVGLQDALWCIRALDYNNEIQQFALKCAHRVEHFDETGGAKKCNDTLEKYLKGEATKNELDGVACDAASAASAARAESAASAASAAARAAACDAWAAASAASAASAAARASSWAASAADKETLKRIKDDFLITFCME